MGTAIFEANITEETLVEQAVRGDLDAFNQLLEAYQDIAFHHAWTYLNDRYLAEDVTQESFIKAFQAIGRFRKGSFRAWLLRIVANTSYDVLRQNKRRQILPLFPEAEDGSVNENPKWLVDSSPSIEETIAAKETGAEIYRLLQELPEIYREVVTLVDIYDFEYKEAAQSLNIKVGTVKSRLMRARLQMQKKLKYSPGFDTPAKSRGYSEEKFKKGKFKPGRQFQWSRT